MLPQSFVLYRLHEEHDATLFIQQMTCTRIVSLDTLSRIEQLV